MSEPMNEAANVEERLIGSFKALAMTEPVERITIKEITDGAGVIRTTFYYHFQDKYELIERIVERDLVDPIMELLKNREIDEAMLLMFQLLEKQRAFYRRLARMEGQNSFEEILRRYISLALEETIRKYGSPEKMQRLKERLPWLTISLITEYYAREVIYALLAFLRTDPPASPEDAARILDFMVRHSPNETIRELFLK